MPQRRRLQVTVALLAVVAVLVLSLSGCQLPFGPQVKVSGTVYGEQVAARQAGKSVPLPLQATITCNGASASSGSDGAFSLSVAQSSNYSCSATAPNYASVTATFSGKGSSFTLAFGPKPAAKCTPGASANVLTCGVLPPATATLRGTVTNAATDQALSHVKVQCWNSALDNISNNGSSRTTTTTDDLGNYVFHNLAVDPYGCVADTDQTLQSTVLTPGKTTTLDIAACESNCPLFKYHQGVVMHHLTVYLIFWLPSGYTFEPNGSSSRFEHLMEQYINDVGGTSFYNVLSQYYDEQGGPVRNVVTLGGSYVDTENYPRAGTQSDPLYDGHISDEVNHVQDLNPSWTIDSEHLFVVFTGYNVQECQGEAATDGCTFSHNYESDFCAYHSTTQYSDMVYAYVPVVDGCLDLPTAQSPNHDTVADAVISILSHEQFEAVSDPTIQGWFDNAANEGEMADKCVRVYGSVGDDGGNVTLNNGHRYIVQEEWSLRDQGCVLALSSASGG